MFLPAASAIRPSKSSRKRAADRQAPAFTRRRSAPDTAAITPAAKKKLREFTGMMERMRDGRGAT